MMNIRPKEKGTLRGLFFFMFYNIFYIFFAKNLHMSNKSSTFAPEIGIDLLKLHRVKRTEQRRGATRKD